MARGMEADVVLACGEHLPAVDVWLVIDVLRATTVIVRWFELGGGELYPVGSTKEARALAKKLSDGGQAPLLMGEENAIPPEGFDLGNSPLDLSRETVWGRRRAVMSTSNGTVALLSAAATGTPVFAACVRNAKAALEHALSIGPRVGLLCAGRKRRPGWDDLLCAGLILEMMRDRSPNILLADGARLALMAWRSASPDLDASMRTADHAVFLDRIGYGPDIAFACERDATDVVPMLHEEPEGNGMRAVLRRAPALPRQPVPTQAAAPKSPEAPARHPDPFSDLLRQLDAVEAATDAGGHFFLGGDAGRRRRQRNLEGRDDS